MNRVHLQGGVVSIYNPCFICREGWWVYTTPVLSVRRGGRSTIPVLSVGRGGGYI